MSELHHHMHRFILPIVLAFAVSGALAQKPQAAKYSTRDEYRACLEEQDSLAPQLPVLQSKIRGHEKDLKQLQDEMNAHVATQSTLDTSSEAAVDSFNSRLEDLNRRGTEVNMRGETLSKSLEAYNAKAAALNKRCAGMVVSNRDRDAVARERAAGGKR